jgi:hypothetical protein
MQQSHEELRFFCFLLVSKIGLKPRTSQCGKFILSFCKITAFHFASQKEYCLPKYHPRKFAAARKTGEIPYRVVNR